MSTNANIMMLNEDGTIDAIYDQWDGDIDGVGSKLNEYYREAFKVRQLISLGDISQLGVVTEASPLVQRFGFNAISNPDVESVVGNNLDDESGSPKEKVYHALLFTEYYFTTACHRDRGEDRSINLYGHYDNVDQVIPQEFNYLYIKNDDDFGHWVVRDAHEDQFHSLDDVLNSKK